MGRQKYNWTALNIHNVGAMVGGALAVAATIALVIGAAMMN